MALWIGWFVLGLGAGSSMGAAAATDGALVNTAFDSTGTVIGRVQNVATGKYLNNARVTVKGTHLTALTDEFGVYRLVDVPGGRVVLDIFYTDLDRQDITVNVPPGGVIERNVELTNQAQGAYAVREIVHDIAREWLVWIHADAGAI